MEFAEVVRINRALVKTAKLYRTLQSGLLAQLELHAGQDALLHTLAQEPDGLVVSEIAARLGIEPPTVTRSLDRLERGGWITREPAAGDRRAVRIRPTSRAIEVVARIEEVWRDMARSLTSELDERERAQLVALLERCREGLRTRVAEHSPAEP
ncbi:MAG TPA: MarR family transcriptional regulator [Euzebyales bacterium]|nr:MarR family transcriptional regulator [Euzebyales bacterium]